MAKRNKPKTTRQEKQTQELAKCFYNYFVFYNAHPSNKDIKINGDSQSLEIFAEVLAELAFDTLEKYIAKEIQLHIKQIQKTQTTPLHYNRADSQNTSDITQPNATTSHTTSHTEQSEVSKNPKIAESSDQVSQIDIQSNNALNANQEKDTREFILKLLFENQQKLKRFK